MITKPKVQVSIVGIVAVAIAIGINLVLYLHYQSRWGEQATRERLNRMMALKPGTPLLCYEERDFLTTLSDGVIVNHWKLVKLDGGNGPRYVIMDRERKRLWELGDCDPIEKVNGKIQSEKDAG